MRERDIINFIGEYFIKEEKRKKKEDLKEEEKTLVFKFDCFSVLLD